MKYWLFCINQATFPNVIKNNIIGVRKDRKKSFSHIKNGDAFVVYISKEKVFRGYGHIESDPFEDDTLIFSSDKIFPNRVKVKFDNISSKIPAYDMIYGLTPFHESHNPANLMMCKGGFIEIAKSDYKRLIKELMS
jgi:predicted RNA-binding protein